MMRSDLDWERQGGARRRARSGAGATPPPSPGPCALVAVHRPGHTCYMRLRTRRRAQNRGTRSWAGS